MPLLLVLNHTQQRRQYHVAAFQGDHHYFQQSGQGVRSHFVTSGGYPIQRNPERVATVSSLFQRKTRKGRTEAIAMLPTLPHMYEYDDSVVFFQRATGTRVEGRIELERSIQRWEKDFEAEVDDTVEHRRSQSNERDITLQSRPRLETISTTTTSPTTLLVRWKLTYVDPSVKWMEALAEIVPGWAADFATYTDRVSEERRFSYSALGKLFARAFSTGKLRVPLACIEAVSTCEFVQNETGSENVTENGTVAGSNTDTRKIRSIVEDLAYAQDLNRGAMANRVCARDLQFFLETARKPMEYYRDGNSINNNRRDGDIASSANGDNNQGRDKLYWEDRVASVLPWKSVPGMMDPLYIEAQAEEDLAANLPVLFGALAIGAVAIFANWIAPELIGQSLFGDPTYIVRPSELNEVIGY
eukprot:jgi/Psemu1/290310/fgenesh1_pg.478_\